MAFVVKVLTAVLSRIAAEEIRAWSPSIIRRLIKFAVGQLPKNQRERFEEEWQSHVNEVPGQVGKLVDAVGFLFAAYNIDWRDRRNQVFEAQLHVLAQFDEAKSAAFAAVNLIQHDPFLADALSVLRETRCLPGSEGWCCYLCCSQELRNRLAKSTASASATPQTLVRNLWCIVFYNRLMRKDFDRILEVAKGLKEDSDVALKVLDEHGSGAGRSQTI